jgi:hypothetical protein
MGRRFVVVGLFVALAGAATGCSTSASPEARPICSFGNPGHLIKTGSGDTSITATAPCTRAATTTTTLPVPVPLGTTVDLSYDYPEQTAARVTVYRVWSVLTPQLEVGFAAPALDQATHRKRVQWFGVDLAIANTSSPNAALGGRIELASPTGPGAPYLSFFVNGNGPGTPAWSLLDDLVFIEGVPGCRFPFPAPLPIADGATVTGCVAVAVPAGVALSEVGFLLRPAAGSSPQRYAQWQA